jgi:hypothetical protein
VHRLQWLGLCPSSVQPVLTVSHWACELHVRQKSANVLCVATRKELGGGAKRYGSCHGGARGTGLNPPVFCVFHGKGGVEAPADVQAMIVLWPWSSRCEPTGAPCCSSDEVCLMAAVHGLTWLRSPAATTSYSLSEMRW